MKAKMRFILAVLMMLQGIIVAVPALAAPLSPSNLAATAVAGPPLGVSLTWTHTRPPLEVGFRVERAIAPSTTFTNLTGLGLPAGSTSFTDQTVTAGVTYNYRVIAFNLDPTPDSPPSNTVTITATVPAAPTLLTVTQQAGPPQTVTLSWTDNSNNEIGFRIERADNAGFTLNPVQNVRTANTAAAPVTFIDADIIPGGTYSYRVSALGVSGASATSNVATITVTAAAGMQAGPVVPVAGFTAPNGFPLYYQDTLGTKLNLLPITAVNFADGVIPGNAYSAALGFGTEAFYYLAAPEITGAGGITGVIEFAIEAIFGSPTGDAVPTVEAVMARTRIRLSLPVSGDYTIQTPYGTRNFPGIVLGAAGGQLGGATLDINFTEDIGAIPRIFSGANSPIAPADPVLNPNPITVFLRPVAPQLGAPAVFGDGVTPTTVTGGPLRNTVIITGPAPVGTVTYSNWTINGKILAAPVVPAFTKSIAPATSVAPAVVTFTSTSTGATTFAWDFGDGTTSTLPNPSKT
ncbi:MAG: hypothetical protein HYX87_06460, partial [Chloroflexi bacterium]|nr:hypothetical protein [Chloroflexota bacterium]